jgi:hypothetical protein
MAPLIADKRPKAELIEKIEKHDVNETKYVAEEKDYVEEADVTRPRHAPNQQLCHEISEEFVRIDKKNQSEGETALRSSSTARPDQQCAQQRKAIKLSIKKSNKLNLPPLRDKFKTVFQL